jgi:hypothetical protein
MAMLISGYSSVRVQLGDAHFDRPLEASSPKPGVARRAAYRRRRRLPTTDGCASSRPVHWTRPSRGLSLLARAASEPRTEAQPESRCEDMWLYGYLFGTMIGGPRA